MHPVGSVRRWSPLGPYSLTKLFSSSAGSVNAEELAKFSAVGREWWDASSRRGTGPLHHMNATRIHFVNMQLSAMHDRLGIKDRKRRHLEGISILDVGCGGGLAAEALTRLGATVTAIDPAIENIKVAKMHSASDSMTSGIRYLNTTVESIASSGEKFDAVCALEVIEHVEDPSSFIGECASCLKDDSNIPASLFISTINRSPKAYMLAILGAEYVMGLLPPGTHDWSKFQSPSEVENYLSSHKLRMQEIQGLVPSIVESIAGSTAHQRRGADTAAMILSGNALKSWSLSSWDKDVNYIVHAVKDIRG